MPSFNTTFQTPDLVATAGTVGDSKTGTIRLPSGTTAQRPAVATAGMVRFNSTSGFMETYTGSAWVTAGYGVAQSFSGLQLRTSPNADVAATTVSVLGLTQWVANDGTPVTDTLTNNTALITNSGAGGLDTGSEAASVWYEIYRIRKSSDGTLNTLLHRAKDYFLDESQTTTDSTLELLEGATTNVKIGQTFDTDVTGYVEFVDIAVQRENSPSGQVWAELYATSAGAPTGSALATSDKLNPSQFASLATQWVRFVFRTPISLTAGTTYALVLNGNYAASATVNAKVVVSTSSVYAAGSIYTYNGTSWSADANKDMSFKVYVTENDAAVTMPSGYDQKCLLGYVYNDSGSNFLQFFQHNRRVEQSKGSSGGITATVQTLYDASANIPPIPVTMLAQANAGSGEILAVAGVTAGYYSEAPYNNGLYLMVPASTVFPVAEFFTEYQGYYARLVSGAGGVALQPRGFVW